MLESFSWAFVPYARPGLPLARATSERLEAGDDVVILGNHGLVVAAETVPEAEHLLGQVTSALRRRVRAAPDSDLEGLRDLACGSPYTLPDDPQIHASATDPISLDHAQKGSLYPDHVVFLGPGVFILDTDESVDEGLDRARTQGSGEPRIILVPG